MATRCWWGVAHQIERASYMIARYLVGQLVPWVRLLGPGLADQSVSRLQGGLRRGTE